MSTKSSIKFLSNTRSLNTPVTALRRLATKLFTVFCLLCLTTLLMGANASESTGSNISASSLWGITAYISSFFGKQDAESRRPQPSPVIETDGNTDLEGFANLPQAPSASPCVPTGVTLNVPSGFATIQLAIDNANPSGGDTIQVAAGMFTEQLVVNKCVTITGAGQAATIIQSPTTLVNSSVPGVNAQIIVEIRSNSYVTMSGLTITGPVPFTFSGPNGGVWGIFIDESATLNMSNARVTAIHKSTGVDGVQAGNGVGVGRSVFNQIGSIDFNNVTVDDYQKTGILVNRTGSGAIITNSTITGVGPTAVIAQNGIQVSAGATATITNSTMSGNQYTPNTFSATGILPFGSGTVTASGNSFDGNDVGVYHFTTSVPVGTLPALNISGNTFTANPDAGIIFDAVTPTITDNFISGSNWGVGGFPTNGEVVNINRNSITSATGPNSAGIIVDDYDATPTTTATLNAHFNRVSTTVNPLSPLVGLQNDTGSMFNAENNFWGCNLGANGGPGCDTAVGTGGSTLAPFLVLGTTTSAPTSVNTGGMTTVTTRLRFDNLGNDTFTVNNHLPNSILTTPTSANSPGGITVNFSATNGLVSPTTVPLDTLLLTDGMASTTFTAGGPFVGNQIAAVTATVDNANYTANIIVVDTTAPTVGITANGPNPTNSSTVSFTVTFTETVTGFSTGGISLLGTTAPAAVVSLVTQIAPMDGTTYRVDVTGMTGMGNITASVNAGAANDTAMPPNPNTASPTAATVGYFTGSLELVVDDFAINCLGNGAPVYNTIQGAVAAASSGYVIRVCPGTYPLASTVNVPLANLTIIAAQPTKPLIQVSGTMDGFDVTATGVTLKNLEIEKIGTGDQHHMVRVEANNFTGQGNYIHGPSWQSPNHVSRAFVINSGIIGTLLDSNTIADLRQPAYFTAGSGTVSNNIVTGTKGWVVDGALITFTNNTFVQTCAACDTDIALLPAAFLNPADTAAYHAFYSPINNLAISSANGNAQIDVQFTAANDSGRANTFVATTGSVNNDGRSGTPYLSIQQAIYDPTPGRVDGTLPGGTVHVAAGSYVEDVAVDRTLTIVGTSGAAATTVSGAIGGPTSTFQLAASNVDLSGFTITRDGNTAAQWGFALNTAGISIQGQTLSGNLIHDNIFTGNRTAIDINDSNGHTIRNNIIDFNRTGLLFRNQTDNMVVLENTITNNWTLGILFLDASGGTNSPVQTAVDSTFTNNNISSNWYGQIQDRQTGGSLPAPGANPKNFQGNWYGTPTPNVQAVPANSTEPGYAAQVPSGYPGGTATAPGGQPDVLGFALANLRYSLPLTSGTDINVQTTGGRGTFGFQGAPLVVNSQGSAGWFFFDDFPGTGTGSGDFAIGPNMPNPLTLGQGSARLTVDALGREAFGTVNYRGIRLDRITKLKYASYQVSGNLAAAPTLQFDVDNDLNDNTITGYQGRLVYDPSNEIPSPTILQGGWQTWDLMSPNARFYGSNGGGTRPVNAACPPSSPCTLATILTLFPNIGIRATPTSTLLFKAGGPNGSNFTGYVDKFELGVSTGNTTFDFEPGRPTVTINQAAGQIDPINTSPINFTAVFSTAVTGFGDVPADITLGGAASPTTAVVTEIAPMNGTTYNVAVSGMTGQGTVTASVADGAATTPPGLGGLSLPSTSTDNSVLFDNVAPTATVSTSAGAYTNAGSSPVPFSVVFTEPVIGFTSGSLTVVNGTVGSIISSGCCTYNFSVTPTGQGTVSVTVTAGGVTDPALNPNPASNTASTIFDSVNPTVTINQAGTQLDPTSTSPVNFTAVFTDVNAISGFTASDVAVQTDTTQACTGCTAFSIYATPMVTISAGPTTFNVAVSGMNQSAPAGSPVRATIPAGAVTDAAGNLSSGSISTDNIVTFNLNNSTVVVSPSNLNGWLTASTDPAALTTFRTGPPPVPIGTGSAQFNVGADGDQSSRLYTQSYSLTPLSSLTELSYSTYVQVTGSGGQAPYLVLRIDTDGNGTPDDRLFFEPVYQTGTYGVVPGNGPVPNQCPLYPVTCVTTGNWQTWNALAGGWYLASDPGGPPLRTLAKFIADNPLAQIVNDPSVAQMFAPGGIYLVAGTGAPDWNNVVGNVDKFVVGFNSSNTTFNFEAIPPTVSIANSTPGAEPSTANIFTVTLSQVSALPVTVDYVAGGGTATSGVDYTATSGTLTIPANTLTQTIPVPTIDDVVFEGPETFNMTLSNAANAAIIGGPATGTIADDETQPTLSIVNTIGGAELPTVANVFTVTLSGQTASTVTVNYLAGGGSSTSGTDYTATSGTLTFAANTPTLTQTITVPTIDDAVFEGPETFNMTLSGPTNSTVTGGPAIGTIADNEVCTFSILPTSQSFAIAGGSGSFGVTVTSGCVWTATSPDPWITTTSTGNGNGTVNFTVGSNAATMTNSGAARTGTITVGGQTFTISQAPAPLQVVIPTGLTGLNGSVIIVPVNVTTTTTGRGITSFDFDINYNPSVFTAPVGFITTGTLSNGWSVIINVTSPGVLSVSGNSASPLVGSGTLLNLTFTINGLAPSCTPLDFATGTFLFGSFQSVAANTTNGQACVVTGTIGGVVTYGNAIGLPVPPRFVPGVVLTPAGSPTITPSTTDSLGAYLLTGFVSGSYVVTPAKANQPNSGGFILANDATEIQRARVGLDPPLTGNRFTAADVNKDGIITSFDASLIQQFRVNINNPGNFTGTWVFVNASNSYPNPAQSNATTDYQAILLGDVSGNWAPPMGPIVDDDKNGQKSTSAFSVLAPVSVTLPTASYGQSVTFDIPITVSDLTAENVTSFDFDLRYDQNIIQPQPPLFTSSGTLSSNCITFANISGVGKLSGSTSCTLPMAGSGTLIKLPFKVIGTTVGSSSPLSFDLFVFNGGTPSNVVTNGQITILATTSAGGSVAGRVLSAGGMGVPKAQVAIADSSGARRTVVSNSFGYFRVDDVPTGATYIISVASKRYTFTPRTIMVTDALTTVDLVAEP